MVTWLLLHQHHYPPQLAYLYLILNIFKISNLSNRGHSVQRGRQPGLAVQKRGEDRGVPAVQLLRQLGPVGVRQVPGGKDPLRSGNVYYLEDITVCYEYVKYL